MKQNSRYELVIVFDANMPSLSRCKKGCTKNTRHLCKHRFGSDIKVIARTKKLEKSELPDLGVSRHVFDLIRSKRRSDDDSGTTSLKGELKARTDAHTRWCLFTQDVFFWDAARKEQREEDGSHRGVYLEFVDNGYVPPGRKSRRGDRVRMKPPTRQAKAKAKIDGRRKEWIVGPAGGRVAQLQVIIMEGPSVHTSGHAQRKAAIAKARELLGKRPE